MPKHGLVVHLVLTSYLTTADTAVTTISLIGKAYMHITIHLSEGEMTRLTSHDRCWHIKSCFERSTPVMIKQPTDPCNGDESASRRSWVVVCRLHGHFSGVGICPCA